MLQRLARTSLLTSLVLNRMATLRELWSSTLLLIRNQRAGSDRDVSYQAAEPKIVDDFDCYDQGVTFVCRMVLQVGYTRIIEIGSYDGSRIIDIKRLLPNIEAIGADVAKSYRNGFTHSGVRFAYFDDLLLPLMGPQTLVYSDHTFPYIAPEELTQILLKIRRAGSDLVVHAPIAMYDNQASVKRSHISYYHPYERMLAECGFSVPGNVEKRVRKHVTLKFCERWYLVHARSGKP